ncbi:hypothetical protein FPV67DRAFT_880088 [Lyophyllum atratum]|nr:hypothetical protein FPV67DRAFT_880088 [Lyophyllum atratum]
MHEESEIILRRSYKPLISSVPPPESQAVATLGGDSLFLREDETWPLCPTCQSPLLPILHLPLFATGHPTEFLNLFTADELPPEPILQFLACSDSECFESTVIQDDCAWLMRIISASAPDMVYVGPGESSSPLGGRAIGLDGQNWRDIHSQLTGDELFKPRYVLDGWTDGKLEMVHNEDRTYVPDVSEDFYTEHAPAEGVKILGYPEKGKFKCGNWGHGCPSDEEGCKWRSIIQLGSLHSEDFDLVR